MKLTQKVIPLVTTTCVACHAPMKKFLGQVIYRVCSVCEKAGNRVTPVMHMAMDLANRMLEHDIENRQK